MKRPFLSWRNPWFVAALLLVAIAAAGASRLPWDYILETRRFMVALKRDGHAPGIGWLSVARRMGPRWMQSDTPTFARNSGTGAPPCEVRWETPLGAFWGSAADGRPLDHLVMEELGGRIYDRAPADLRAGDTVLDVGAHLGTFTRYALNHGAARVVAIEAMPDIMKCFRLTFANEIASGRVVPIEAAAWSEDAPLEFQVGRESTMGAVREDAVAGSRMLRVRGARIDTLMREAGIARIDFIKMDIEGAEPDAIAGASGVIAASRPRMALCVYHGDDHIDRVPAAVRRAHAGYQTFFRGQFQAYFHQ